MKFDLNSAVIVCATAVVACGFMAEILLLCYEKFGWMIAIAVLMCIAAFVIGGMKHDG